MKDKLSFNYVYSYFININWLFNAIGDGFFWRDTRSKSDSQERNSRRYKVGYNIVIIYYGL